MILAIALHVLAAVVWVGGMFFAILILRPASGDLEPKDRLPLWGRVFQKFFPWVWTSLIVLFATGYWMIFSKYHGFAGLPTYIHLMHGVAWIMLLVYLHLWFAPYKRFKAALAAGEPPVAAKNLNQIRWLVVTNLCLGLITVLIAGTGRYWQLPS